MAEFVYGCVRWDWRWDSQDERGVYLARLVRDLGLPLGPVVEGLAGDEERCERAVRVLALLAVSGFGEAREALRGYVGEGEHWAMAMEEMARRWPVEWWEDLEEVARKRAVGERVGEPWERWGMVEVRPAKGARAPKPLAGETNARLLELLADPAESEERRIAALDELDDRGPEPGVIPLVPSLGTADGEYVLWPLIGVVEKLGAAAVPAAREWVGAEQAWLRGLGYRVLVEHGEVEDVPVLVERLERDWVEKRWCGPVRTARGLARFGAEARGAVSLLRRFWLWTPHSYERVGYLEALREIEPAGLESVYVECLWDCEEDARLLGARNVRDGVGVWERLAYLRDDVMEAEVVRAAAGARLAALAG
ncbi:hypothetical protein [Kitasatospora sp. NPDC093806]|uniref:hypothetical protein n=1 Tax=Kitasatospora sp. NPDC093806 TaxID=3155075 RepID=UPI0034362B3E